MKRILICGMMFGLLTGVGFAQRGRAVGGVGPAVGGAGATARMPGTPTIGMTPNVGAMPNAVTTTHGTTAPNAVPGATNAKTVTPNATNGAKAAPVTPNSGNATTVSPNANTVPNRDIDPDAQGISDHSRVSPNQ
jgi:hypothetical protein